MQDSQRERIGNASESRAVDIENIVVFSRRAVNRRRAGRCSEVSAVKVIKSFGAKLKSGSLGKIEVFTQDEINRPEVRTVQESALQRSGLTCRDIEKRLPRECRIAGCRSEIAARCGSVRSDQARVYKKTPLGVRYIPTRSFIWASVKLKFAVCLAERAPLLRLSVPCGSRIEIGAPEAY